MSNVRIKRPDGTEIRNRRKVRLSKSAAQRWGEARERVLLLKALAPSEPEPSPTRKEVPTLGYEVLASVPLMLQYESVLTRSEHLIAAGLSEGDVRVLLDAVALVATPVRISYLWRPMLPDPDDDLVLETAVNGHAEAVITFNRRHFEPAAARFGVEILAPAEAVRRLEGRS